MSTKHYPKRPEKLDHGSSWVTVVRAEGAGVPADERAWCTEYLSRFRPGEDDAKELALAWYAETDQSSEAEVTLRIETWKGEAFTFTVVLEPAIVARVKPVVPERDPRQGVAGGGTPPAQATQKGGM